MSFRKENILSLTGGIQEDKTILGLENTFRRVLKSGIHGICFSAYEEGQKAGDKLSAAQIRRRLKILKPYTKWVRTFSCTDGNELIPEMAKELGMKTLVGAWLGEDRSINEKEIEGLVRLAEKGCVDIAAVGNEVMYRGDLSETALITYIKSVKRLIPEIPVGYVDAYYEFTDRPKITEVCDIILANCYPYWEGCSQEYALIYMKDMYNRALKAANGKKVVITETGWPSEGLGLHGAKPSREHAIKYFINAQEWSKSDNIDLFYFSSFDESWKVGTEGDVGAYWGIWDKNEKPKYYSKLPFLKLKK
ncbi:glycosyl hydrolase family 17 protein [Formosa algae]|uniref:Endo-1,3-beta-glucanase btgC n=1 Tax=Formosa algae TaxID=225843 RepID=A0A9X0YJT5_9FLAO|nr:glycosyl hydrolase family 17 protein [Formosa algae]MBP1839919.1 exo-beta-1,3-glucanase (GH17 family) [Formosa algae]MDQ0335518.1 exo-beta-1,3-glucanase (GH17 family) [Formosa algae]OEI81778.1 glycosyl hydrolase [Formosa algae]